MKTIFNNVDEYIKAQPESVKLKLEKLRKAIVLAAPNAEEVISYGMPAYKLQGMLVYFAAHKNHIGFYPILSANIYFNAEIAPYHTSKGTLQFSNDKPIPLSLITKIVKFRVKENIEKEKARALKFSSKKSVTK